MPFRFGVLAFSLLLPISAAHADWSLTPASSLQKLTATAPGQLEPFQTKFVDLRAVRGEWESFQVVVTASDKPIEKLEIRANGLATPGAAFIPADRLEIYRENYVSIPHPSGNRELRPLWWPDALIPLKLAPQRIEARQSAVYWVTVKVPQDAEPGNYFGELDVLADGQPRRLAMSLTVEPLTLPPLSMRANVAVYYGVVRDWYAKNAGKTYTDTEWQAQQRRYYDFLLDYGLNAYDLPVAWGTPEAAAYLQDPRVHSVRVPPLDNGDFPKALAQLKATGTLDKAYYYYIDEPQPDRYAAIQDATAKLRPLSIKHCVTVHPNKTLKDAVDIWCPNIGDFFGINHLDLAALEAERKKGRETWWYTMVEPRAPYPTWLVDDDAEAVRSYGAMMARYGITGFVYSMAHGWGPKPLEDITSYANTSGDGTLIYPAEIVGGEGPMPSIRLMLLRDALEDYELLRQTRRQFEQEPLPFTGTKIWLDRRPLFAALRAQQNPGKAGHALYPIMTPDFDPIPSTPTSKTFPLRPASRLPVMVDGVLGEWKPWERFNGAFGRASSEAEKYSSTSLWLRHDRKTLYLAVRAAQAQTGEWIAVDLASQDIQEEPERLRFVVTQRGKVVVERHTREGHFQVEVPGLKAAVKVDRDFWNAELAIPLEPLGYGDQFRFNVRRRTSDPATGTKFTLSAVPDSEDPWRMPVVMVR